MLRPLKLCSDRQEKSDVFGHTVSDSSVYSREPNEIWFLNHSHIQFEIQSDFLQICQSERSGCISNNIFVNNDLNFVLLSTEGFYDLYVTLYKLLNIVWSCVWTPSYSLTLFSHSKLVHWSQQCLCHVLSCALWVHIWAEQNFHLSILTGSCSQLSWVSLLTLHWRLHHYSNWCRYTGNWLHILNKQIRLHHLPYKMTVLKIRSD